MPNFFHLSWHEWKLTKFSWYLTFFPSHLNNIYLKSFALLHNLMRNYEILWKLMRLYETNEVSWNFLGIMLCFCSVVTYFVDFRFHFRCFRKLTTKSHFHVERFEILKFRTWLIESNTWPKQFYNNGPWWFPDSVVWKLKKKKPDELVPRLFDKCHSAKWRLSIDLNWSYEL